MGRTFVGETLTMSGGIDNAIFVSTPFSELATGDAKHAPPIICDTENRSHAYTLRSTKTVSENRLSLEINRNKERIQTQKVERVLWYNTKQLADCLTEKDSSAHISY